MVAGLVVAGLVVAGLVVTGLVVAGFVVLAAGEVGGVVVGTVVLAGLICAGRICVVLAPAGAGVPLDRPASAKPAAVPGGGQHERQGERDREQDLAAAR